MEPTRVTIRMYKGLLGDCFLLILEKGSERSCIMIDCGALQGTAGGSKKMEDIAENIAKECGGRLQLLVVTHEHWDHISGFAQAEKVFDEKIVIEQVWLAWTEDPDDKQAKGLRDRFSSEAKALRKVAELANKDRAPAKGVVKPLGMASGRALEGLEQFMGPLSGDPAFALTRRKTGRQIMEDLRACGEQPPAFLEPGEIAPTPGALSLRAHVLGPPRNEKLLFKDLPTGGDGDKHFSAARFNRALLIGLDTGKRPALREGDPPGDFNASDESPFAKRYRNPAMFADAVAESDGKLADEPANRPLQDWLRRRYFSEMPPCRFGDNKPRDHICKWDPVCGAKQDYRRIDGDWLAAAGALALKLDSDTNNTSLVLAFKLPDDSYLLFAADAQVGNWESWKEQQYGKKTIENILAATRFYKVGHHGSHNATLLEHLNRMHEQDLVAMIPTDEAFARRQGRKGWRMPDEIVRDPLMKRTKGRVLYGDRKWGFLPDGKPDPAFAALKHDADFKSRLHEDDPLFVDYRVYGEED